MNPKISIIKNLLVSFRINNWIKNLLVFSALSIMSRTSIGLIEAMFIGSTSMP
jgi:hypothetical protein